MKLKVSCGGAAPGSYVAKFLGIEAFTDDRYGGGLRWHFEILNGPYKGFKVGRITQPTPTPKNACGKMLSGLLGRALAGGEEVDLEALVGKSYLVVIAQAENGGSRVDAVAAAPTALAPSA